MKKMVSLLCIISYIFVNLPFMVIAEEDSTLFATDFEGGLAGCGLSLSSNNSDFDVVNYSGSSKLLVNTLKDGSTAVASASFKANISGTITISEEFIQKDVKSDGNVVMSLFNGSTGLLSIETNNGDIAYKKKDGSFISIVSNYLPNMSYDIKAEVSLTAKNANIYVNGELVLKTIDLRSTDYSTNGQNYYKVSTKYSPGFYIDDVKIYLGTVKDSLLIEGKTEASIPQTGVLEYVYKVQNVSGSVNWSLKSAVSGASLASGDNANEIILKVSSDVASGCTIILCAELASDSSVKSKFAIKLFKQSPDKIKIDGPAKITHSKELNTFSYSVQAVDTYGNPYIDQNIKVELKKKVSDIPVSVLFDSSTLTITTTDELPKDEQFIMFAYLVSDPAISCEKIITMETWDTYMADEYRMKILQNVCDNILEKCVDRYRFTPLIPTYIDIDTNEYAIATSPSYDTINGGKDFVTSNLAAQGNFMRTFEALTKLSDDEKYQKKVDDVYQYWLDNGMSNYGVPYWGGHMALNMIDGKPVYAPDNQYTHELKDFGPYYDPFFRLDPKKAEKMVASIYSLHISNWKTLSFNRHGVFTKEHDWDMWYTPEKFEYENEGLIISTDIPFRSVVNDFVYAASRCYENIKDTNSLTWALRLLQRYYDVEHVETRLGGYQFTTGYALDPKKAYTDPTNVPDKKYVIYNPWLPNTWPNQYSDLRDATLAAGAWYDVSPWSQYRVAVTGISFGDRVFNQYADDLIDQGYFTEEEKYMIREANLSTGSYSMSERAFVEADFAESLKDTKSAESDKILWDLLWASGTLVEKAYTKSTNSFKRVAYDGRSLNGFIVKRNGYNSTKGIVFSSSLPDPDFFAAAIRIYLATKDLVEKGYTRRIEGKDMKPYTNIDKKALINAGYTETADGGYEKYYTPAELQKKRDSLWKCIQNIAKANGYGSIGENAPGKDMKINYYTVQDQPMDIMAFLWLYEATGVVEYLDLARVIAGNMIDNHYFNGFFVDSKENQYATIGYEFGNYTYSLALLEAAIRGEFGEYPKYYNAASTALDYNFDNKETGGRTGEGSAFKKKKMKGVLTTSIQVDTDNIYLSAGESKKMLVTVEPDDASNKAINWNCKNSKIARIDPETNTIYGISKGQTVIYGISDDKKSKIDITVTVTD